MTRWDNERKAYQTRAANRRVQQQYASLSLPETFEHIYSSDVWGDAEQNSGRGSTGRYVAEYGALLERLLRQYDVQSVADLGCGNFNTGKVIARMVPRYIGVDIAQPVITANTQAYATKSVTFMRADATKDLLPTADAALVRQVLQHLTNHEIQLALTNILNTYRLVFITEHVYIGPGTKPNRDFGHGPGTRIPLKSGVFIDCPPFNIQATVAGDIAYTPNEVLRTWMVERLTFKQLLN